MKAEIMTYKMSQVSIRRRSTSRMVESRRKRRR